MWKQALPWSLWVLVLSVIAACAPPSPEMTAPSPIEVTGQSAKTTKIVSLAPSNTEILFALGLGNRVVGVTDYCNYPPEAELKEKIGGFSTVDIEKVIALDPDLILAAPIHEKTVTPELERRGLNVLTLEAKTLDEVVQSIALVGEATGAEERASELVGDMRKRIEAVTSKTQGLPSPQLPKVFYLTWHDPLWTSGSGTLTHDLIQKAGGMNIAQDLTGYKTIGLEMVIGRNPQVIIACSGGSGGHGEAGDLPLQYIKTEPRLRDTEARKNNRVHQIDTDLISRPGPRIVDALEQLARFIHPELFP